MLRLLRAGARPGRPAPAARLVAVILVVGLVLTASPFLAGLFMWVIGLL